MELIEAKKRAEKAVQLQGKMEELFGSHPFYQELAITAAIVEAAYQGGQEGQHKVLANIPSNQVLEQVKETFNRDYPETFKQGFMEGANYIINALTDHLKDES
ncbi:MAG: hypothetical protein DRJ64_04970 [Thermoprotei archaeon]|nr:MAG: hypothetical protein DRJ64_04970 [Thermoprotei archaeon]